MLWNNDAHILSFELAILLKPKKYKMEAPKLIRIVAVIAIPLKVLPTPPTPNSSKVFPLSRRVFNSVPLTIKPCKNVVIAIKPRPPINNIIAKISCPKNVKSIPTSIIDNPVTVTAEVAVNKASHRPTFSLEQKGVDNNNVPQVITSKPVTTVNCGTVSLL